MHHTIRAFRELSSHSIGYGLSTVLSRLIGFVSVPILSYYFQPDEYGVISLVQVALSLAVILTGMNVGSGVSFYFFKNNSRETREKVIGSGIVYILVTGVTMSSALYLFSPHISEILNIRLNRELFYSFTPYLKIGAVYLFFGILMTAFQNILRLHKQPYKYLVCELTNFTVNILLLLLFICFFGLGLEGVFWARAAGVFAGCSVGLFYVKKKFALCISASLLFPILFYSLPQFPASIMGWGQAQASRFFINYFTDLHVQGVFAVAFAFASILNLANAAFRLGYDPYALSIMKQETAKDVYANIYTIYSLVFGILLVLLLSFVQPMITIFTPPSYHESHTLCYFLAGSFFLAGCNNILGTGIWVTGKTIYSSYCQACNFVTVVASSYILIPQYKGIGAALSIFAGSIIHSIALYLVSRRQYKINYRYVHSLLFVILAVCFAFIFGSLEQDFNAMKLISYSFVIFFVLSIFTVLILAPKGTMKLLIGYLKSSV